MNESTELAKDYIEMAGDGDIMFDDQGDIVVINDDGTKFNVIKKDVPMGILHHFMKVVQG